MFNGTRQNVSIKSMTPSSKIYVDGNFEGEDAVSVKLNRKDDHSVIVKKDGYDSEVINIGTSAQAAWIVFDLFFNPLAFLTDAPTGAWNNFDRSKITVDLHRK
jgi:hypothetical protein